MTPPCNYENPLPWKYKKINRYICVDHNLHDMIFHMYTFHGSHENIEFYQNFLANRNYTMVRIQHFVLPEKNVSKNCNLYKCTYIIIIVFSDFMQ
jgi:hypothetical protein